jgi:hypothetical protein
MRAPVAGAAPALTFRTTHVASSMDHATGRVPLRGVRGSSPGVLFGGLLWFVVHHVHVPADPAEKAGGPRHFHAIVRLDAATLRFRDISKIFTLAGAAVERVFGLVVEDTRVLMSYSVWDATPTIGVYDRAVLERDLLE